MILAAVVAAAFVARADTEKVGGYTWTYQINGDTAEIYSGGYYSAAISPKPNGAVTIPDTLGGKPVTSIGNYAFSGCTNLTSVSIPNSVTSIGYGAFYYCSGLTNVTIPDSVTNIGELAFQYCRGLTNVTIGSRVTSIGHRAFSDCSELKSITIPNSVTSIGGSAFSDCSGLTSVTIGNGVTSIEGYAFYNCSRLTSVTIPDSVMSIGDYAFYGCANMTSVTIGNGMTSIECGNMFYHCTNLTSVTIPNSVTNINDRVFDGLNALENITVPQCVMDRGIGNVFYGRTVNGGATSLENPLDITLADGVTSIPDSAFNGYRIKVKRLSIPASVVSIGRSAVRGLHIVQDSPMKIDIAPDNAVFKFVDDMLISYAYGNVTVIYSPLTSGYVTIPDSVTSIGDYAFYNCSGLTSVTIPNSVTSIGNYAFSGCSGLTSVTIPNSVTNIGYGAFSGCSGLTSVTIPDSVTSIGNSAFYNCSGLTSVTIPESVTNLSTSAFDGCGKLWTAWYKTLANASASGGGSAGGGSPSVSTTIVQQVEAPYALTGEPADRAIASVTVNSDCAIDEFVLKDGKVYDSMLYVSNTADKEVKISLPDGCDYKTFKGVKPLTIPAKSQCMISITRVADKTFLVAREDLEDVK